MNRAWAGVAIACVTIAACGGSSSNKSAATTSTTAPPTTTTTASLETCLRIITDVQSGQRQMNAVDYADQCGPLPAGTVFDTTTTTTLPKMPSGDPVFPGYPKLVPVSAIDSRVRSWFQLNPMPSDQVVEVAPGVFAPYNPVVPDLASYLDGVVDGDCTVRNRYFPSAGGSCWNGVAAT